MTSRYEAHQTAFKLGLSRWRKEADHSRPHGIVRKRVAQRKFIRIEGAVNTSSCLQLRVSVQSCRYPPTQQADVLLTVYRS